MLQETLSLLMTLRRYTVQFIVLHNSHSELCLVREKVLAHKPIFCVVFFYSLSRQNSSTMHESRFLDMSREEESHLLLTEFW